MTLNRHIAPRLHPIAKPNYIRPEWFELKNGIKLYATKAGREEMMRIDWAFAAGSWQQNKALVASLTCSMLQEGSAKFSGRAIAELVDFHGAYLHAHCSHHCATLSLICLKKHLPQLLPVVESLLKKPSFPEKEFLNIVARLRQSFSVKMEKVKHLAEKAFSQALFGENHPYSSSLQLDDFDAVQLDELRVFYARHYHAAHAEMQLVGQYDQSTIALLEQHFGGNDWAGEASKPASHDIVSATGSLLRVPKADAIQSAIKLGKLSIDHRHPDHFKLKITTALLGGYFGSRLMTNIREDKGYTYGIGAGYNSKSQASYLLIGTEVDKQYEEATRKEIQFEINRLQQELVPEQELNILKQYLVGEFLRSFDGGFQQLALFKNLHELGLDYSYYDQYFESIHCITAEDIRQTAQAHWSPEHLITVVAGAGS